MQDGSTFFSMLYWFQKLGIHYNFPVSSEVSTPLMVNARRDGSDHVMHRYISLKSGTFLSLFFQRKSRRAKFLFEIILWLTNKSSFISLRKDQRAPFISRDGWEMAFLSMWAWVVKQKVYLLSIILWTEKVYFGLMHESFIYLTPAICISCHLGISQMVSASLCCFIIPFVRQPMLTFLSECEICLWFWCTCTVQSLPSTWGGQCAFWVH